MTLRTSRLAEVRWEFDGNDANWHYCDQYATFAHREACEFIIHVGSDPDDDPDNPPYWKQTLQRMLESGCSNRFIATYLRAKDEGAERILFYA